MSEENFKNTMWKAVICSSLALLETDIFFLWNRTVEESYFDYL